MHKEVHEPVRSPMNALHGKHMAVLYTKPGQCGGACLYCVRSRGFTRSTVENQDTRWAQDSAWSSHGQLERRFKANRLERGAGHKIEFRIKGESFTSYSPQYLESFILEGISFLAQQAVKTREEAIDIQRLSVSGDHCVQIVVETRPDLITPEWCEWMKRWGITTVELGVQSLDDKVLTINRRGHGVEAVAAASELVRSNGFELTYHLMVGLPGSSLALDEEMMLGRLFERNFRPDNLKIYPCILFGGRRAQSALYSWKERGWWEPLTSADYLEFLWRVLPCMPRDVHINRVQRILEPRQISGGPADIVDRSSFRPFVQEMWQRSYQNVPAPFRIIDGWSVRTEGSDGLYSLQAVTSQDVLLGYLRLSIHGERAIIRDLRVLGQPLSVGSSESGPGVLQHSGVGGALLDSSLSLARKQGCSVAEAQCSFGSVEYFRDRGFVGNDLCVRKDLTRNTHSHR